ncbi:MAG: hypothetical protein GXO42_01155 [bacterium]|nr:hypothetical protein [bacterium]
MRRLQRFVKEYPHLVLALTLFALSLVCLAVHGLKEGPELRGGIIVELYVPGYTVKLTGNLSLLEHVPGIEILGKQGNAYIVVAFSNSTLNYLRKHFHVLQVTAGLPAYYLFTRILDIIRARLNALGIGGITVGTWSNKYIIIEAPLSVKSQLKKVLELGKFEIRVNNVTVATGKDVIPSSVIVREDENGYWGVDFMLTQAAARKLLQVVRQFHYNVTISMVFENRTIFSARPAPELLAAWKAGKLVTAFRAITGPEGYFEVRAANCSETVFYDLGARYVKQLGKHLYGVYFSRPVTSSWLKQQLEKAGCQVYSVVSSEEKAKELALALRSGALPVKPVVLAVYYVEPVLAKEIRRAVIALFLAAFLGVFIVVYLRYRKTRYVLPIYLTLIMEIVIILGIASIINWVIDIPAIVGLLMVVATGINDQIVILDELLFGKKVKRSIKEAFFIIYMCAAATIATIFPLFWIYQFRGFALTTTLGILVAVFITRPAYAEIAEKLFRLSR